MLRFQFNIDEKNAEKCIDVLKNGLVALFENTLDRSH